MVLRRLFRKEVAASPAPYRIPEDRRVYAIGDIHGCDDLFAELIDLIESDDTAAGPAETTLILLGDLVDRGPSSRQVIDRAIGLSRRWPDVRLLMGNHEEVFLKALRGDAQLVRYFVQIGGAPTINSYGLTGDAYYCMGFEELAEQLPALVPEEHKEFLASGVDQIRIGDYLFVHAGIRPGVPADEQRSSDLRWIREDFLGDRRDHGLMVVHGHTISHDVEEMANRIGVDTGAYRSGVLSAVVLQGSERRYIQTGGRAAR